MGEPEIKPVLLLYAVGLVGGTKTLFKRKEKIRFVCKFMQLRNSIIRQFKTKQKFIGQKSLSLNYSYIINERKVFNEVG